MTLAQLRYAITVAGASSMNEGVGSGGWSRAF